MSLPYGSLRTANSQTVMTRAGSRRAGTPCTPRSGRCLSAGKRIERGASEERTSSRSSESRADLATSRPAELLENCMSRSVPIEFRSKTFETRPGTALAYVVTIMSGMSGAGVKLTYEDFVPLSGRRKAARVDRRGALRDAVTRHQSSTNIRQPALADSFVSRTAARR